MKHILEFNNNYMSIRFDGSITTTDADEISSKIIKYLRSSIENPFDFIMDIRNGSLNGIGPIITIAMRLQVHIYRFNYCYVIGDLPDKYKYAFSFFKLIQAKRHKVQLASNFSEALIEINSRKFKRNNTIHIENDVNPTQFQLPIDLLQTKFKL